MPNPAPQFFHYPAKVPGILAKKISRIIEALERFSLTPP